MSLRRSLFAPGMAATLSAPLAVPAVAQEEGGAIEQEVRDVVNRFRATLQSGDSTTVVQLLHPEARIYEGGHAETRDEYRSGHLLSDMAFLQAVSSETTRDQVVPGEALALYMSERHTVGEYRGREIESRNTETIVVVSTPQGWRIRHIHWSNR